MSWILYSGHFVVLQDTSDPSKVLHALLFSTMFSFVGLPRFSCFPWGFRLFAALGVTWRYCDVSRFSFPLAPWLQPVSPMVMPARVSRVSHCGFESLLCGLAVGLLMSPVLIVALAWGAFDFFVQLCLISH